MEICIHVLDNQHSPYIVENLLKLQATLSAAMRAFLASIIMLDGGTTFLHTNLLTVIHLMGIPRARMWCTACFEIPSDIAESGITGSSSAERSSRAYRTKLL